MRLLGATKAAPLRRLTWSHQELPSTVHRSRMSFRGASSSFSESDILELLILGKRLEDEQLLSTGFGNQTVSILGALLENQLEKNLKESNVAMMN